jgi:hypothetical protein
MAEAGVPESTMLALAGHMSRAMLERYSRRDSHSLDLPIAVKQDGRVVKRLLDAIVRPWPARIASPEHLQAEAVHVGEYPMLLPGFSATRSDSNLL